VDQFLIEGPSRLEGEIPVSGAKNAALPCIAAALLTDEPVRLENLPNVADIRTLGRVLQHVGASVDVPAGMRLTLKRADSGKLALSLEPERAT